MKTTWHILECIAYLGEVESAWIITDGNNTCIAQRAGDGKIYRKAPFESMKQEKDDPKD